VATGPRLSDALISSPIIVEDGAVPGAGFEFGIDPNEDPELALVGISVYSHVPSPYDLYCIGGTLSLTQSVSLYTCILLSCSIVLQFKQWLRK